MITFPKLVILFGQNTGNNMNKTILVALAICSTQILLGQKTNYVSQISNKPVADAREFVWSRTNGSGVSGDLGSAGTKTINLSSCPFGINGTNPNHYVRIFDGIGTAEVVKIIGGTCISGSTSGGTLIFITANAHTGSWKIGTATVGIQEAAFSASTPHLVFLAKGTHILYAPITFPSPSTYQYGIIGESRINTIIQVDSSFPLTALGVIVNLPGLGPHLEKFRLVLPQPDSSNLASFTHWPPALFLRGVQYSEIEELLIEGAWRGFECSGGTSPTENCNASRFTNIWLAAYNRGFVIDGSLDSIRISGLHYWPFGGTANNFTAFADPSNIGIEIGRADDVKISDSLFISGVGIKISDMGNGQSTGEISNTDFDSQSGIIMSAGTWVANSVLWSTAGSNNANKQFINITGGNLTMSNSTGVVGPGNTLPIIQANFNNTQENNTLILTGNSINTAFLDVTAISAEVTSGTAGSLIASNNWFYRNPNIAYTKPTISITSTGLRAVVTNNNTFVKGTGAGTFISATADVHHILGPNNTIDWTNTYPTGIVGSYFADSKQFTLGGGITSKFIGPFTFYRGVVGLANGTNNDITIIAPYMSIAGPNAAFSITGFAGGKDGQIIYVGNPTGAQMTIVNQSGSIAANQILTNTGADVVLRAGNSFATFIYDSGLSRWILMSNN